MNDEREPEGGRSVGGRLKSPRPDGWSKAWVLETLANDKSGLSLRKQANFWAISCDSTRDSLLAEVRAWKRTDPEFSEALAPFVRPGNYHHPSRDDVDGAWRERFIGFYLQHKNRKKAAEEAGVPWATVMKKLAKRGPEFDERLYAMVEEADSEVLEGAREMMKVGMDRLLTDASTDWKAADAAVRHAIAIHERLDSEIWAKKDKSTLLIDFRATLEQRQVALAGVAQFANRFALKAGDDVIEGEEVPS